MTKTFNELLEEAMRLCDSTMKETIDDYLFLRKEADGQSSLDDLRKGLEENENLRKQWRKTNDY